MCFQCKMPVLCFTIAFTKCSVHIAVERQGEHKSAGGNVELWFFWSWNSSTLATWCKEPTHWKRPWCWERWEAGGEGDDRGWDDWMALLSQWTWIWVNSGSSRWTGRAGVLQSMGLQKVGHDWVTELNWWTLGCVCLFKLVFLFLDQTSQT